MLSKFTAVFLLFLAAAGSFVGAGEPIPHVEIQALDRAIARELNEKALGSQTLGDLQRLKYRLEKFLQPPGTARQAALAPLTVGEDSISQTLAQLESEAQNNNRSALRSLTLYQIFLGNPETALGYWEKVGQGNPNDIAFQILSAYIKLSLGEYNPARESLDAAARLMDTRTQLAISRPVFCENIAGYRLYVPREKKDVLPGEDVLVYVEVDGADFKSTGDGYSECQIMFGLKLKNDIERVVWSETNYGEYSPVFNGPIRDLHTALTWRVPNDLGPGVYTLTVEAVEDSSKRRGENSVSFNVAKRATNAETRPGAGAGAGYTPEMRKTIEEAQRQFPGASTEFQLLNNKDLMQRFESDARQYDSEKFDLIRRGEQMKRGDR